MWRFNDGPGDDLWIESTKFSQNWPVDALLEHLNDLEGFGKKMLRPGMFGNVLMANDKYVGKSLQESVVIGH